MTLRQSTAVERGLLWHAGPAGSTCDAVSSHPALLCWGPGHQALQNGIELPAVTLKGRHYCILI